MQQCMSSHRLCIWLHDLNALAIQKDENCSTVQWGFHGMPWEHANFCCDDAFGPIGFPDCWDEVHLWLQSLDQVPFLLLLFWMLQNQPSVLAVSLILAFWLSVYWKLAQKNVFPMQWYHYAVRKRMQRTACSEMSFVERLQVHCKGEWHCGWVGKS